MTPGDAIAAVAAHCEMLPQEFEAWKAPSGSIREGLWYAQELDVEVMPIDDCVWIVLPDHTVKRGIPVGNPIHSPTPRGDLFPAS